MSAGPFFQGLAIAMGAAFVVVVLALVPTFRQTLREDPPAWSPWRVVAFIIAFSLAFQVLDLVRR